MSGYRTHRPRARHRPFRVRGRRRPGSPPATLPHQVGATASSERLFSRGQAHAESWAPPCPHTLLPRRRSSLARRPRPHRPVFPALSWVSRTLSPLAWQTWRGASMTRVRFSGSQCSMPCRWLVFDAVASLSSRPQCARCRRRRTCARFWVLVFGLATRLRRTRLSWPFPGRRGRGRAARPAGDGGWCSAVVRAGLHWQAGWASAPALARVFRNGLSGSLALHIAASFDLSHIQREHRRRDPH
jgi:hypothetical protein